MIPSTTDRGIKLTADQQGCRQSLWGAFQRFLNSTDLLSEEERFGVFCIFGARGSGKTTLLREVCKDLTGLNKVKVIDSLDFTTLSPQLPLGLSVLEHLSSQMTSAVKPSEELQKTWKELLGLYLSRDIHYRDLRLSLAVTASEYKEIAQIEALSGSKIKTSLKKWLDVLIRESTTGIVPETIVISLEDVDLAIELLNRSFFSTFFNELQDSRLAFIMAADENHLEQHILGKKMERHPQTVVQLLAKLVPESHRVYLDPWSLAESLVFRPVGSDVTVSELLQNYADKIPNFRLTAGDLYPILPRYPRGLSDLHQRLRELLDTKDAPVTEESNWIDDLLFTFARCRGDRHLARRLKSRPLDWWATRFYWSPGALIPGFWERLLADARTNVEIVGLEPSQPAFGPSDTGDEAAWTEVLLNVSLRQRHDTAMLFIQRFSHLEERIEASQFEYVPDIYELNRMFERYREQVESPWIEWQGSRGPDVRLRVGWGPLLGLRESSLPEILHDMGVSALERSPSSWRREILLPLDVRSLLVLAQEMSNLPWRRIADWAPSRSLEDWFLMLALLSGGAYLRALSDRVQEVKMDPGEFISWNRAEELTGPALRLKLIELNGLASLAEGREHPMAVATRGFFSSPAVQVPLGGGT